MKKFFIFFLTLFSFLTMLHSTDNALEQQFKTLANRIVTKESDKNLIRITEHAPFLDFGCRARYSLWRILRTYKLNDAQTKTTFSQLLTRQGFSSSPELANHLAELVRANAKERLRPLQKAERKEKRVKERKEAWERALESIRAMARSQPK